MHGSAYLPFEHARDDFDDQYRSIPIEIVAEVLPDCRIDDDE